MTYLDCLQTTVPQLTTANKYYISMNLKVLQTHQIVGFKVNFKLWHKIFRSLKFILWTCLA